MDAKVKNALQLSNKNFSLDYVSRVLCVSSTAQVPDKGKYVEELFENKNGIWDILSESFENWENKLLPLRGHMENLIVKTNVQNIIEGGVESVMPDDTDSIAKSDRIIADMNECYQRMKSLREKYPTIRWKGVRAGKQICKDEFYKAAFDLFSLNIKLFEFYWEQNWLTQVSERDTVDHSTKRISDTIKIISENIIASVIGE